MYPFSKKKKSTPAKINNQSTPDELDDDEMVQKVLDDDKLYAALRAFMTPRLALENLNFLDATDHPYMNRINWLVETYVRPPPIDEEDDNLGFGSDASPSINLSFSLRQRILDALAGLPKSVTCPTNFGAAQGANGYHSSIGTGLNMAFKNGRSPGMVAINEMRNAINAARTEIRFGIKQNFLRDFLKSDEYKEASETPRRRRFRMFRW